MQLLEGYGLTETSAGAFVNRPSHQRVGTVGQLLPGMECTIASDGEVRLRGPNVMRGYWNDEEKTRDSIDAAGWMHTGDLAIIDEEGFCNIVGRVKDMIIRGGENVYPREIEEYL